MQRFVDGVRLLSRVSGVVAILLILTSLLVICQMIVVREVLGQSSIWQTEFVTYSLVAATFIGAPYVLLTKGHVNVDLIPLLVGHRTRVVLALVASVLSLAFCLIVLWNSFYWWQEAFDRNYLTSTMWRARLWIPYLSVPLGMGLLSLQYVADIWALLSGLEMPFGLKPEDSYESA
jgi:TRAP-type C4-dicarboxylate transport system permease small subunit